MSFLSFAALKQHPAGRLLCGLLRWGGWVGVAAASLAVLAWLTLHWGILPRLDDWRPQAERAIGQRLGVELRIGRIETRSSGWVPAFTLHDVVLRDARGREALRLPQVSAALSVPSLLGLKLRFAQLLVDDARLEVRRDAQGRWLVAGLDMAGDGPAVDSGAAADWLFEQGELVVRRGTVRWTDEARGAPPLALRDVRFVLRNHGRRHELRLDATPPADWGDRFGLQLRARQPLFDREGFVRAGDWRRWSGSLYAELPRADAAQLRRHVDLPFELIHGQAGLRAWIDFERGRPRALTLDAALDGVALRLARELAPLELASAAARLQAQRLDDGARVALQGLRFRTHDGIDWQPSNLALKWQWAQSASPTRPVTGGGAASAARSAPADAAAPGGAASGAAPLGWVEDLLLPVSRPVVAGTVQADRLDVAPLVVLAERLPIGAGVRRLIAQLDPQGRVQALDARWSGPLDAPATYQVRAQGRGLALAAAASPEPGAIGRPGWRGADLDITAGETGGQATLKIDDGALSFPGVFEQPEVALSQGSARLAWRIEPVPAAPAGTPPRLSGSVSDAHFANADVQGTVQATWRTGPGSGFGPGGRLPGILEMTGQLAQGQAASIARYLPLGIGADTRHWVQRAVQGGQVQDVAFRVKGDLWDFPFVHRRQGEFRIAGKVSGATLAVVPSVPAGAAEPAWDSPWPAFTQVNGELVFEREAMQFQRVRAQLWGVTLDNVQGRIRSLSDKALLEVEGSARGPAADLLRYVRSTPVDGWIGHALSSASAAGNAELKLALNMPLHRLDDTVVRGEVLLPGNDLRLLPELPLLANARARIDFTHRGVQVRAGRLQALGGEAAVEGGSQPDGSLRFTVAGTATAEGLRRAAEWPALAHWAGRLQGQSAYRLSLGFVQGQPDWTLTSALQGMAIDLPAPLRKPAEAVWPLKLQAGPLPARTGAPPQDAWRLELGPLLAQVQRDLSKPQPQLLRSALALGAALPEPVAGGRAVLDLPAALDVDAWRALWAAPGTPSGAGAGDADEWVPRSISLRVPELLLAGRRFSHARIDLQRQLGTAEDGWSGRVVADQAQGSIDYREPRHGPGPGRFKARLARLALPPAEPEPPTDAPLPPPVNPPALDIEVEQFELGGRALGRLVVEASHRAAAGEGRASARGEVQAPARGGARGDARTGPGADEPGAAAWRLGRLQLVNADANLLASGHWQALPGGAGRRMALEFKLGVDDSGRLLERLGFGRVVQGGKGELEGTLGWDGSPLALHMPSLGGAFKLTLARGQFLKANAGAARLLGVLSLQALPRRLMLDFRDLFAEGFAFDEVTGDMKVLHGVVSTNNFRMRGLQAAVLMEGSADIAHETQDLHAVVLPELNTASASLAYAAINPAVGLGALFGQWLLREPLRQASAREFRITGSWDEPVVTQIERKFSDPLPRQAALLDAPSTAAAAAAPAPASAPAARAAASAASGLPPPAPPGPSSASPPGTR